MENFNEINLDLLFGFTVINICLSGFGLLINIVNDYKINNKINDLIKNVDNLYEIYITNYDSDSDTDSETFSDSLSEYEDNTYDFMKNMLKATFDSLKENNVGDKKTKNIFYINLNKSLDSDKTSYKTKNLDIDYEVDTDEKDSENTEDFVERP